MDNLTSQISDNAFALFVLYLVISSNFLAPLFSCRLQQHIEGSMLIRHILGFLTLTFFVVVASKTAPLSFGKVMGFSAFFYTWFLLTTRMHIEFWFITILLVGAIYVIHLYQSDLTSDKPTEEQDKQFSLAKKILAIGAGATTLVGFITYLGEKKLEYKNRFSYAEFFLGAPDCRGESPNVSLVESFRAGVGL
jgi:hypothetical protein